MQLVFHLIAYGCAWLKCMNQIWGLFLLAKTKIFLSLTTPLSPYLRMQGTLNDAIMLAFSVSNECLTLFFLTNQNR